MSQSESDSADGIDESELEQYRTTEGAEMRTADVASDEHALKQTIGDDEDAKKMVYDARIAGERFMDLYDDRGAAVREYLSNAETACIRRAKMELREAGLSVPTDVAEMLQKASEQTSYDPVIEVTYNQKPESVTLVIEDNGIGISVEEYEVLRRVGYSASHSDGDRLGQFGMGYLSGFLLAGPEGVMRMYTRSKQTDEAFSTANYIANFEFLDGLRDGYGTRFEFPSFCNEAQKLDVRDKIAHYAEGMRVPVLYEEYDRSGNHSFDEDYTPRNIEDDYPEDSLVITYENEFFKAVMSPDSAENRRGLVTYNVTVPIRRNTDEWSSEPKFDAPWKHDVRVKKENGPIVKCESDPSVVGLSPVSDQKYGNMADENKDDHIRRSDVPDDAIEIPRPASSRDSYKSKRGDPFWRHVSEKLAEAWNEEAADLLTSLDKFEDYLDLDASDKAIVNRAYSDFGPRTTQGGDESDDDRAENINEALDENLDVTIDTDVAIKLDKLTHKTRHIPRDTDEPRLKGNSVEKQVWNILDAANDGEVYMAKTPSDKKCEIVWGLDDNNQCVRVEDYEKWEDLFGWKQMKGLPSRNLKDKLPGLDDDVADKWENKTSSSQSKSSGSSTSMDPKTKRLKVRMGKGRKKYTRHKAESIKDALDNGNSISAGRWNDADYLLLYNSNKRSTAPTHHTGNGIASAAAPNYVREYLEDADNVFTDIDDLREEMADYVVDLSDGTQAPLGSLDDSDAIILGKSTFRDEFEGREDDLLDWLHDNCTHEGFDEVDRVTILASDEAKQFHMVDTDARMLAQSYNRSERDAVRTVKDYKLSPSTAEIYLDIELPDADRDSDEWEFCFKRGRHTSTKMNDQLRSAVEMFQNADCLPTN